MSDTHSVEIDLTVETIADAQGAARVAERHGVRLTMIEAAGPGGGWPVYRVEGPRADVEAALREWGYEEVTE